MSTETPPETDTFEIETDDTTEFDESALFDFNMAWFVATAAGFFGGLLFMMGWYGVLAARYVPRVVLGAAAVCVTAFGSVGMYWMLRTEYPDVFSELRQIPNRLD